MAVSSPQTTDLAKVVDEYRRAFNARDLDAWVQLLDPQIEIEVDSFTLRGIEAARGFAEGLDKTYPGVVSELQRVVAMSADTVVTESRLVNPNADASDEDAWYLDGLSCMIFEFRDGRVARLRTYYAPSPNDRTAQANVPSRTEAGRIAEEQAALRRVATLVAEDVPPSELFAAVTREVGTVIGADFSAMARFEDRDLVTLAVWAAVGDEPRFPERLKMQPGDPATAIAEAGEAVRWDDWTQIPGPMAAYVRDDLGVRSTVGLPIVVEGRLWGAMAVHSKREQPLPPDTERRMEQFAQLLETAIANADSRDRLIASRARLLAAGDEARRRVVRDLHDGAQQRLVSAIVTLKLAQRALQDNDAEAESLVGEALQAVKQGNEELRELAHGILPTVLTRGGLQAAVNLIVARLDVPVDVDIPHERFPAEIEASAYFIVAEALTNAVKHAQATRAEVRASVEHGMLRAEVRDDGIGGADPRGHGLVGMSDRVAALQGRLELDSPPGAGTIVVATLPISRG